MVTISVCPSCVQTNGVAQPDFIGAASVRATFHSSAPVFASSAVRNDVPSLSCS
jgi:hypothetical protein